jgi:hypothetical protein
MKENLPAYAQGDNPKLAGGTCKRTAMTAGALLFLPLGASTLRILRRRLAA